jgi:hypothetical protein
MIEDRAWTGGYTISDERAWFEHIGRQVYSKAVRKAQETVTREDITLGPDPTPVFVEVGEEKFIFGVQKQGNTDAAEGEQRRKVIVTIGPITICCRCYMDCWMGSSDCLLVCVGSCC